MRAYLAFKALMQDNDGTPVSPGRRKRWDKALLDGHEYYALVSRENDNCDYCGILATGWDEAMRRRNHRSKIYMVAPAPELADRHNLEIIFEIGWRATAAIVVGEFDRHEAAKQIVAAHDAGYPQVGKILLWAALLVGDRNTLDRVFQDLQNGSLESRVLVAVSEHATEKILLNALEDKSRTVRLNAASNPKATEEVLLKALRDKVTPIIKRAVSNHSATETVLLEALKDNRIGVRKLAASHQNATEKVLEVALQDPSETVRESALRRKWRSK